MYSVVAIDTVDTVHNTPGWYCSWFAMQHKHSLLDDMAVCAQSLAGSRRVSAVVARAWSRRANPNYQCVALVYLARMLLCAC